MRVKLTNKDIFQWARRWPGSGLLDLDGITFEYAANGDLVDIEYANGSSEDWDGPALLALSQDAQVGLVGRKARWA